MSAFDKLSLRVILYEGPGTTPLTDSQRFELVSSVLEAGYSVSRWVDVCQVFAADASVPVVLGRFDDEEPAHAVCVEGGAKPHFCDISELDADRTLIQLRHIGEAVGARDPGAWKPWFPVIDYDRCTHCMQCLSFCLFGVFCVDEGGRIQVHSQANCKTDCPACARVCPELAILFPKYHEGPIAGDVVREADLQREAMKVDVSAILGGDSYSVLRKRNEDERGRLSAERPDSPKPEWDI